MHHFSLYLTGQEFTSTLLFSIQNLAKDPAEWNPKDADKITKTLGDLYQLGKVRTGGKDILYRETADALAKFEVKGAKPLAKAAVNKRFKDNLSLRAHLVAPTRMQLLLAGRLTELSQPYEAVVGAVTPSTHSIPTLAGNIVNIVAAGNAVVFNAHPAASRCAKSTCSTRAPRTGRSPRRSSWRAPRRRGGHRGAVVGTRLARGPSSVSAANSRSSSVAPCSSSVAP